jgi:hypothetical protein
MNYFVTRNGQQLGPFTEADIKAKLAAGEFTPQDLVWWDGQKEWVRLDQTPLAGGAVAPGTTTAAAYVPAGRPTSSSTAIASLVCGVIAVVNGCPTLFCCLLAGLPFIFGILAIFFGHRSLSDIKANPDLSGSKTIATSGLVLGYIATALSLLYVVAMVIWIAAFGSFDGSFKKFEDQINSMSGSSSTNSADDDSDSTNAPATNPPAANAPTSTNSPATNAPSDEK